MIHITERHSLYSWVVSDLSLELSDSHDLVYSLFPPLVCWSLVWFQPRDELVLSFLGFGFLGLVLACRKNTPLPALPAKMIKGKVSYSR